MTIGLLFWVLMILWAIFGAWGNLPPAGSPRTAYVPFGRSLLLFVLLFLLGWRAFGFVIQN